jgi:hypothetical protein
VQNSLSFFYEKLHQRAHIDDETVTHVGFDVSFAGLYFLSFIDASDHLTSQRPVV